MWQLVQHTKTTADQTERYQRHGKRRRFSAPKGCLDFSLSKLKNGRTRIRVGKRTNTNHDKPYMDISSEESGGHNILIKSQFLQHSTGNERTRHVTKIEREKTRKQETCGIVTVIVIPGRTQRQRQREKRQTTATDTFWCSCQFKDLA